MRFRRTRNLEITIEKLNKYTLELQTMCHKEDCKKAKFYRHLRSRINEYPM